MASEARTDPFLRLRRRIPIAAIAVLGLGALMALAVGVVLYLGLASGTTNTRQLLQAQAEALIDFIEQGIDARLSPVAAQGRWIADQVESATVDIDDKHSLDAFMLGALAATPQVAGLAIVNRDASTRRWGREPREVIEEDWVDRPEIIEWLNAGEQQKGPAWQPPFWTHTLGTTVVMHDTPLHRNGRYIGMLAQVVPIADLSGQLAEVQSRMGMVAFILHGRNRVLAHSRLVDWTPESTAREAPLPHLQEIGDRALERIWSPDDESLFLLRDLSRSKASGALVGEDYYVFLYRDIGQYGHDPWTIGAYLNTETHVLGTDQLRRLGLALAVGLVVLVLSVLLAAWLGRRISRPIQALSAAAHIVEEHGLEQAPTLLPSAIRELDDASRSFNRMVSGLRDRQLIRETLGRFVPEEVAQTLLSEGGRLEAIQTEATVLFCDLEGFTALTEATGPTKIVGLLNEYFQAMVSILERHQGVVTQFQGDAILATFNVPIHNPAHAANALRAAAEMRATVREATYAGKRVDNRIGVSSGSLVAGAVGALGRLSYTVHGDAVNLAARLEALNKQFGTRVLVSAHTAALVDGFDLELVGETRVRGQSQPVELFELRDGSPPDGP